MKAIEAIKKKSSVLCKDTPKQKQNKKGVVPLKVSHSSMPSGQSLLSVVADAAAIEKRAINASKASGWRKKNVYNRGEKGEEGGRHKFLDHEGCYDSSAHSNARYDK